MGTIQVRVRYHTDKYDSEIVWVVGEVSNEAIGQDAQPTVVGPGSVC